ncbi:hypothetical protein Dimus_036709 [Dionaea muscipula]
MLQEGLSSPMDEFRPDLSGSGEDLIPLVANQPDLVSKFEGLTPILEVAKLEGLSQVDGEGGVAMDSVTVGLRTPPMVDVDGVMKVDVGLPASIDAGNDSLVEEVREDGSSDAGELLIIRNPVRCSSILSVSLPYSVANKPLDEEGALLRDAATGDGDLGVVVSKLGSCPMASVSFFPETSALFVADACPAQVLELLPVAVKEDKSLAGVSGLKGDITEDRGRGAVVGMSPVVLDDSSVDRVFQVHSVSPFADNVIDSICPLYDVVGSVEGGRMFSDNGGLVSEVVLVTPAAIAALRPQPTDGLRQPPLSPVEPAVVARSGPGVLSAVGLPGCGAVTPGRAAIFKRAVALHSASSEALRLANSLPLLRAVSAEAWRAARTSMANSLPSREQRHSRPADPMCGQRFLHGVGTIPPRGQPTSRPTTLLRAVARCGQQTSVWVSSS